MKQEIADNIYELINRIDFNKIYEIKGIDITINISPLELADKYFNLSFQNNLKHCDEFLREKLNIPYNKTITFIQIIDENNQRELNYIYYDNLINFNLSLCNEILPEDSIHLILLLKIVLKTHLKISIILMKI